MVNPKFQILTYSPVSRYAVDIWHNYCGTGILPVFDSLFRRCLNGIMRVDRPRESLIPYNKQAIIIF
jgi:hypothetical protein